MFPMHGTVCHNKAILLHCRYSFAWCFAWQFHGLKNPGRMHGINECTRHKSCTWFECRLLHKAVLDQLRSPWSSHLSQASFIQENNHPIVKQVPDCSVSHRQQSLMFDFAQLTTSSWQSSTCNCKGILRLYIVKVVIRSSDQLTNSSASETRPGLGSHTDSRSMWLSRSDFASSMTFWSHIGTVKHGSTACQT